MINNITIDIKIRFDDCKFENGFTANLGEYTKMLQ